MSHNFTNDIEQVIYLKKRKSSPTTSEIKNPEDKIIIVDDKKSNNEPINIEIISIKSVINKKQKILRFSKGSIRRDCITNGCEIQVKKNFTLCGACFNKRIRKCCEKCKKELLNDDIDVNNHTSYDKHKKTCFL